MAELDVKPHPYAKFTRVFNIFIFLFLLFFPDFYPKHAFLGHLPRGLWSHSAYTVQLLPLQDGKTDLRLADCSCSRARALARGNSWRAGSAHAHTGGLCNNPSSGCHQAWGRGYLCSCHHSKSLLNSSWSIVLSFSLMTPFQGDWEVLSFSLYFLLIDSSTLPFQLLRIVPPYLFTYLLNLLRWHQLIKLCRIQCTVL